jgi:hypothetical protein
VTPDELRALIARTERDALANPDEDEAAEQLARAEHLKRVLVKLQGLQPPSRSGKKKAMQSVARMHISESKAEDPLQVAANAAGYTMRTLEAELRAEGYRCSRQFLMQCRRGDANIRESLAKRIEDKLGKDDKGRARFAATRKNWPGNAWAKEPTEG